MTVSDVHFYPKLVQVKAATYHNPESHLIGEIVQTRITRLMARSNGIDVVGLHEQEILLHELVWDSPAMDRVMLMSVCTFDNNAFSVHLDQAILELHLSEADTMRDHLVLT